MKVHLSTAVVCILWSVSSLAGAQSQEMPVTQAYPEKVAFRKDGLAAPRNALELSLATGYTQGFGELSANVGLPSVISAGVGLDFGVGWRINPRWAVLWTGEYQSFTAERTDTAGGVTSTVGVQYHFAPTGRTDPWVELGAGYRFLWETPNFGPTLETHGFQLVHARLGLDFRTDEQISLGPVIGADATMFRWQDASYYSAYISDQRVSTFIFAGVQGRFDIGGKGSASSYEVIAKR